MADNEKDNILYVRMFGGFSMSWNGQPVAGGGKSSETQFTYLMQFLIHNRENGVSRDQLEQILFEDRDIANPHHAMQSVIYNTKKKLKNIFSDGCIVKKGGLYHWGDKVPIKEDASEFDRLCKEAEAAEDPGQKLALYLDACHCYTGEFLGAQSGMVWAAQEARRYRGLFCHCVEEAAELLREREDYIQMESLGLYASAIQPLADWEAVTMEALVSSGRHEDARKFYDDTVELYFQEQGLRPSGRLMELLNSLGTQLEHHFAVLDEIQSKLAEEKDDTPGGYFCSYPVFQGIYHMVERMMERGGQSVYLMLCTVVDSKGNPVKDSPMLEELSARLGEAIRQSVRRSDAVNKYGRGQYLILLVNTTRENCGIMQRRINYHFIVGRQRIGVQYYVNSVVCTPDKERIIIGQGKG